MARCSPSSEEAPPSPQPRTQTTVGSSSATASLRSFLRPPWLEPVAVSLPPHPTPTEFDPGSEPTPGPHEAQNATGWLLLLKCLPAGAHLPSDRGLGTRAAPVPGARGFAAPMGTQRPSPRRTRLDVSAALLEVELGGRCPPCSERSGRVVSDTATGPARAEAGTEPHPAAGPPLPKEKAGSAGSSRQQDGRDRAGGGDPAVLAFWGRGGQPLGRAGQPGRLQALQHPLRVRHQRLGEEGGPVSAPRRVSGPLAFEELMAVP